MLHVPELISVTGFAMFKLGSDRNFPAICIRATDLNGLETAE